MRLIKPLAVLGAGFFLSCACPRAACADEVGSEPAKDIVATASAAGSFQTLLTAAKAAGLVETLQSKGPLTLFAPTDAAFAKLPAGTVEALLKDKKKLRSILTYHVVSGKVPASKVVGLRFAETVQGQSLSVRADKSGVRIDEARVVQTDIAASNGVIHVVDTVLMPRKDIVDTAVAAGSFQTLVTAVKAADLVATLKGKGPFTLFAPNDAAFAKLPDGTVAALLQKKPKLAEILTYHVVNGRVLADAIAQGKSEVATVAGGKLRIHRDDQGVTVNGARVIQADVLAGNGVIHVVDTVLLPE